MSANLPPVPGAHEYLKARRKSDAASQGSGDPQGRVPLCRHSAGGRPPSPPRSRAWAQAAAQIGGALGPAGRLGEGGQAA